MFIHPEGRMWLENYIVAFVERGASVGEDTHYWYTFWSVHDWWRKNKPPGPCAFDLWLKAAMKQISEE